MTVHACIFTYIQFSFSVYAPKSLSFPLIMETAFSPLPSSLWPCFVLPCCGAAWRSSPKIRAADESKQSIRGSPKSHQPQPTSSPARGTYKAEELTESSTADPHNPDRPEQPVEIKDEKAEDTTQRLGRLCLSLNSSRHCRWHKSKKQCLGLLLTSKSVFSNRPNWNC